MGQLLLLTIGALVVGAIGFGIAVLISGSDPGLAPVESEGRAVPLPGDRPLVESDLARLRFDTAPRGYRMAQVDAALRRAAYDIGYKLELIDVLRAEVDALREGRLADADKLRDAREVATRSVRGHSAEPAETGAAPVTIDLDAEPAPAKPAESDAAQAAKSGAAKSTDSVTTEPTAGPDDPSHEPQEMRLS